MILDLDLAEIELLSCILNDFKTRNDKYCCLYVLHEDKLHSLIAKVDF